VPRTGFDPRAHGFHFANDFVDKVVTVPGFGEVATEGRAGGMAFAALDYWFAGLPVPSHRPEDFPDRAVPEDGSRLADFIHKRLFDSHATWSARQFLTWALAEDHPTWSSPGVAAMTAEELPRVRRSLDAGRPVVLGLVGARALDEVARNRQVVAYGYDEDGAGPGGGPVRLFVYDSHHPDTEVVLAPEPDGGWEASAGGGPWRGLFLQDYARERPPYIDLGAAKGIWVNSWTPTLGGNFVAQFTARNYGDYRAHVAELRLAVRGPAGENLDRFLGGDGDPSPIEPGEERAVFKASDGFGTVPGGLLALRLAIGDQAVRWPEEGMADVQDGKRFELDQRFDLVLNPSSVLSVSVTGSDAAGAPAGVVREPYLGLDDWGAGEHAYRSRLDPPGPERPGPDAGDGPWTIEYAVEVTPLEA
jgi:hypothetical protein